MTNEGKKGRAKYSAHLWIAAKERSFAQELTTLA